MLPCYEGRYIAWIVRYLKQAHNQGRVAAAAGVAAAVAAAACTAATVAATAAAWLLLVWAPAAAAAAAGEGFARQAAYLSLRQRKRGSRDSCWCPMAAALLLLLWLGAGSAPRWCSVPGVNVNRNLVDVTKQAAYRH
jgi:hypothetical protein